MTITGFVVGTTLVNTLFLFDLFVTKFQQKKSMWGSTMSVVYGMSALFMLIPWYTLVVLWFFGLILGNYIITLQVAASILYWAWMAVLYGTSTYLYYKWEIPKLLEKKD